MKNKEQTELISPNHKQKLVLREAKTGKNIGTKFWGCPTWSKTKYNYTVPFETRERKKYKIKNRKVQKPGNKKGIMSLIKKILMIPIYVIGFGFKMLDKVYSNTRQKRF